MILPLSGACACGQDLSELPATPLPERRQVTELVIRREVTEYRTVAGTCPCGCGHRSAFPDAVRAPVQYGPGVSAFAVFLTQFHHLPYQRTADLLASVAGITLSPGTIYTLVQAAAARLAAPVAAIGEALIKQTVAHADETGVRIGGKLHWLHVLSATWLTFLPSMPSADARPWRPSGSSPASAAFSSMIIGRPMLAMIARMPTAMPIICAN